jgi:pimeloyl-ACP methyl ester carboxylesterase
MNRQSRARWFPIWVAAAVSLSACGGSEAPPQPNGAPDRVKNAVIIIHGVGNQSPGYSKPMQDLLKAEMPSLHVVEVLWSDLGSVLRRAQDPARQKEQEAAEQALLDEIDAAEQKALGPPKASPGTPQQQQMRDEYAAARGFVSPIVSYEFLSAGERRRIQQRLRDALDWSAQHADRTVVVAHSLGSVIAFDTLHGWESTAPPGKVALLTTMGSPLGKLIFVGRGGRPTGRPSLVGTWRNFHSPNDVISSALAGPYSSVDDRRVSTPVLPLAAHGAYWTHVDVVSEILSTVRAGG